eukprot:TRINITY_DN67760_c7_g4_i3.p3 TRINITY_DN67760_c7_g4~~TRINITY_DN67760_c7_g4_i3.p3  ORF type:complete len:114 (-),score=0.24 TRINITY_DN67760_c7_g4_i3:390-731(-)
MLQLVGPNQYPKRIPIEGPTPPKAGILLPLFGSVSSLPDKEGTLVKQRGASPNPPLANKKQQENRVLSPPPLAPMSVFFVCQPGCCLDWFPFPSCYASIYHSIALSHFMQLQK